MAHGRMVVVIAALLAAAWMPGTGSLAHAAAVSGGTVYGWGTNSDNELGFNPRTRPRSTSRFAFQPEFVSPRSRRGSRSPSPSHRTALSMDGGTTATISSASATSAAFRACARQLRFASPFPPG
jgi:hypothetical protein